MDGKPVAELFTARQAGPLAAVVVLGAAGDGALPREVAQRLAHNGYAAVTIATEQIEPESFEGVIGRLGAVPTVDRARIGLIGIGPGAEKALLIAAHHSVVRAVVAVAPGAGALIPVERIAGPILLVAGADDSRWPAVEVADTIIERLATHRFAHGVSLHSYGNAGHRLFGPPMDRSDPLAMQLSELGGSLEGNVTARKDSWRKTMNFLEDTLGATPPVSSQPVLVHDDWFLPR
jgi:dienelactone hydrolase